MDAIQLVKPGRRVFRRGSVAVTAAITAVALMVGVSAGFLLAVDRGSASAQAGSATRGLSVGSTSALKTPAVLVLTARPDGSVACTNLTSSSANIVVFHRTGTRLDVPACELHRAGGTIGLGLSFP